METATIHTDFDLCYRALCSRDPLIPLFPSPEVLALADMRGLGLTRNRTIALQALAHAVLEEGLVLEHGADRERTMTQLRSIPGIGAWTASYIAMRALGDPDAFPGTDLGLRHAFEQQGVASDSRSIERRAVVWRPWRAYAAYHLWANLPTAEPMRQISPPKLSASDTFRTSDRLLVAEK